MSRNTTAPVALAHDDCVKVILANDSRLLREMLRRVLGRAPELMIVAEVDDLRQLEPLLAQTDAQWIIVSLTPQGEFPDIVKNLLQVHSTAHGLAIAVDGSTVRVLHMEPNEQQVDIFSGEEILSLLQAQAG